MNIISCLFALLYRTETMSYYEYIHEYIFIWMLTHTKSTFDTWPVLICLEKNDSCQKFIRNKTRSTYNNPFLYKWFKYHIYADDVQNFTKSFWWCCMCLVPFILLSQGFQSWMLNTLLKLNKRKLDSLLLSLSTIKIPCNILLLILVVMWFPLCLPFATWVSVLTTPWA